MTKPVNPFTIRAVANDEAEILIYGDIGDSWDGESVAAAQFVKDLQQIDASLLIVRINSYGGSVTDGLAIYNALRRHPAAVDMHIDGIAASIASLIAMAGDTVTMADNAMMMIHAPWGFAMGNAQDMREMADTLDKYAQAMAASYSARAGVDADWILSLLTDGQDHWFTAQEAVDAGLADGTSEALPVAAQFLPDVRRRYPSFPAARAASLISRGDGTMSLPNHPKPKPNHSTPPAAGGQPAAADPPLDPDAIRAQALQAEADRRKAIKAKFKAFMDHDGVADLLEACLDDPDCTPQAAGEKLLARLAQGAEPVQGRHIDAGLDARDKFRQGVVAALQAKAGIPDADGRPLSLTGNQFRGHSLLELARASLELAGVRTGHMDKREVVATAFTHTSSDFPSLLMDVAEKSMLKGYEEAEETFQLWTSRGNLPDFKPAHRVALENFPSLKKVDEGAEYTYATIGERGETIQLATYGAMFAITRQAIINDDLNAFTAIPRKMGRAAIRTVGNLVYAILTDNPKMSDGKALFHADHKNLLSAAALSTATVNAMRTAMAKQKGKAGEVLNIRLRYLVVPVALQGQANVVRDSEFEVGGNNDRTIPNSVRGTFEVIADARLDDASATAWFGVANPAMHDVVEVAYLDGQDRPYLEQQQGWNVDGTEFKVRIDAGVKALDWRTLAKNPGA